MNPCLRRSAAAVILAATLGAVPAAVAGLADFDPNDGPVGWVGRPVAWPPWVYTGTNPANRTRLFALDYNSLKWSGNLHSWPLDAAGNILATDDWTDGAAGQVAAQVQADTRRIVTRNAGNTIAFQWTSLSAAQRTALGSSTVLDYLRGATTNEGTAPGKYRGRASPLGDIMHSTPAYCPASLCGAATVFVGANDGALHAIDAATGKERFAYIPSMLLGQLAGFPSQSYAHTYYVDGPIGIRRFGAQTILVGALGGGGRGLFALDVTTISDVPFDLRDDKLATIGNTIKVLWEITNATTGYANLGYTYSQPWLATLPNGTNAVVVGNGYNNTGNGRASLFVITAATGALISEIVTSDAGTAASRNGLSSPVLLDVDGDGKDEYAYAGDLDGNLWKFNLATSTATRLHTVDPPQSITTMPAVASHPKGGYMINFATGRLLLAADVDKARHYAYGIWDGAPAGNTSLFAQVLTERTWGAAPGVRVRTAAPGAAGAAAPNWAAGGHKGWRTELPVDGERLVGDGAIVTDGIFVFLSTNPSVAATPPAPAGENWWMELNALTGGDNDGQVRLDLDANGQLDAADTVKINNVATAPVGRHLGGGVRSQLLQLTAGTTNVYHANYDRNSGTAPPLGRGVSGGHFDYDIYYFSGGKYANVKHKHEYDDIYDVVGVNMLAASLPDFNLPNAIASASTKFKILVMNQYLNPAATLAVGPPEAGQANKSYESVRTYGGLASVTNAQTLLNGLPVYTRQGASAITTFTFKLPLDAFASKDWWGDGAAARAGLIPTQTGCVHGVSATGVPANPGPNGERFNGALTIQIVKDTTPASALELNGPNVTYGWRVKASEFSRYVLAEYTTFWHHPNGKCYGASGWVQDPPEDFTSDAKPAAPAAGSSDPKGSFGGTGGGATVVSVTNNPDGSKTTKYSDGTVVIEYPDGTTKYTQPDGTVSVTTSGVSTGGGVKSDNTIDKTGVQDLNPGRSVSGWRELRR